jgi:hypothetical protein
MNVEDEVIDATVLEDLEVGGSDLVVTSTEVTIDTDLFKADITNNAVSVGTAARNSTFQVGTDFLVSPATNLVSIDTDAVQVDTSTRTVTVGTVGNTGSMTVNGSITATGTLTASAVGAGGTVSATNLQAIASVLCLGTVSSAVSSSGQVTQTNAGLTSTFAGDVNVANLVTGVSGTTGQVNTRNVNASGSINAIDNVQALGTVSGATITQTNSGNTSTFAGPVNTGALSVDGIIGSTGNITTSGAVSANEYIHTGTAPATFGGNVSAPQVTTTNAGLTSAFAGTVTTPNITIGNAITTQNASSNHSILGSVAVGGALSTTQNFTCTHLSATSANTNAFTGPITCPSLTVGGSAITPTIKHYAYFQWQVDTPAANVWHSTKYNVTLLDSVGSWTYTASSITIPAGHYVFTLKTNTVNLPAGAYVKIRCALLENTWRSLQNADRLNMAGLYVTAVDQEASISINISPAAVNASVYHFLQIDRLH